VVGNDHTVLGFVDDLARLPKPLPEPSTIPDPQTETTPTETKATPTSSPTSGHHQAVSSTSRSSSRSTARTSDNEAAALAARADRIELDILAAKTAGPSVQKALDRSTIPPVDMSAAAARNIGAAHDANGDLKVATGGPVTAAKSNLSALATGTRRQGPEHAGTDGNPAGPSAVVNMSPATTNAPISDADRVVATLRPRFRKCYQDGLQSDPGMSGKTVLVAKIGPNGEVLSSDVSETAGLSSGVTSCLARVLSNAQFTGNGAVTNLRVPVNMVNLQK
jgi:hypothetical protein